MACIEEPMIGLIKTKSAFTQRSNIIEFTGGNVDKKMILVKVQI